MEPLPLAVGGVFAGWLARGFSGLEQPPVPAPIACSCSCECPSREEAAGWSTSWLITLSFLISLLSLIGGAVAYHFIRTLISSNSPEFVITPPSKGKKGYGVVSERAKVVVFERANLVAFERGILVSSYHGFHGFYGSPG